LKVFLDTIVANDEVDEEVAKEVYKYLNNNREGIKNLLTLGKKSKSCAEGQISHVLSHRFSRNPLAWMHNSLEALPKIRVFLLNGGELKEEHFKKENKAMEEHKEKIIELRKKAAPEISCHNLNITELIPKTRNNCFLKGIASGGRLF